MIPSVIYIYSVFYHDLFTAGINPPVDDWKKVIDDMNSKTRKLEEDYEGTCISKKVSHLKQITMPHLLCIVVFTATLALVSNYKSCFWHYNVSVQVQDTWRGHEEPRRGHL